MIALNLDRGYVHARSKESRKDGSFEVIVDKSTTGEGATTRFGLVSGELLQLCAFLAPDRIPEELIRDGANC